MTEAEIIERYTAMKPCVDPDPEETDPHTVWLVVTPRKEPMTKQNEAVIKTPVRISYSDTHHIWIEDASGALVCEPVTEADAHAIAHGLNSQVALVELIQLYDVWGNDPTPATGRALDKCIEQLRSAIALTKGTK